MPLWFFDTPADWLTLFGQSSESSCSPFVRVIFNSSAKATLSKEGSSLALCVDSHSEEINMARVISIVNPHLKVIQTQHVR